MDEITYSISNPDFDVGLANDMIWSYVKLLIH